VCILANLDDRVRLAFCRFRCALKITSLCRERKRQHHQHVRSTEPITMQNQYDTVFQDCYVAPTEFASTEFTGSHGTGTHRNAVPVLFWSPEQRSGSFSRCRTLYLLHFNTRFLFLRSVRCALHVARQPRSVLTY